MAILTVQVISRAGLTPSLGAAAAGGDDFPNSGKTYLHVANANVSVARTVTIASNYATPPVGTAQSDVVVSVPASTEMLIGPFPQNSFNDAQGRCNVTYSSEADLTVAAIELP